MAGEELLTQGIQGMAGNVANLTGGLISGITGFFQKKKANKLLQQNVRPVESIPQEVLANQEMAKNMANEGLPSQQYQQGLKNIERQQTAALNSAQDRRLGGALVGAIQQGTNDSIGNLDVANAEARRQNQLNLQNVNNQVGSWRDKVWQWNNKQKYIDQQAYAQGLLGMGNANFYGGMDKFIGGAIGAGANGLNAGKGAGAPSFSGLGGNSAASSYMGMPPANTSGGYNSPASGIGYIDPNSAPSLI